MSVHDPPPPSTLPTTNSVRPISGGDAGVRTPARREGARMSAVNLDDKLAVVLIDVQKGILGLPTAVPPNESRGTACAAPS
jgi:hypothetical protein